MNFKKFLSLIIVFLLTVMLSACGLSGTVKSTTSTANQSATSLNASNRQTSWFDAWSASTTNFTYLAKRLSVDNQTLRFFVTPTIGGSQVRIKLSNKYGDKALRIGAAAIALAKTDRTLINGSQVTLTFNGKSQITIARGEIVWSDPVSLSITTARKVAVSIYVANHITQLTGVRGGIESFHSKSGGNFQLSSDSENKFAETTESAQSSVYVAPFFSALQVMTSSKTRTIVTFGDSITTFNWPDFLAGRLQDAGIDNLAVVREAISGNRILFDCPTKYKGLFGPSGLSRIEESITSHKNVKYVIILQGINDITLNNGSAPASQAVSADQVIAGLKKYIEIAHEHQIKIYGATIMPFEGIRLYNAENESKRLAVNQWIRTSQSFDAVIDFDKAVRDPNNLTALLSAYDSGDHIHQGDEGSKTMAEAVDLSLFK